MPTEYNSVKKFKDREHAAELLISKLNNEIKDEIAKDVVVFGIPRGGVILAYTIYKNRSANYFDIVIPRKLGAPNNKELGIGAIMDKDTVYLNEYVVKALRVSQDYIETEKESQIQEISRRSLLYRPKQNEYDIKNKTIILVDDGAATGATLVVSARWIRKMNPKRIIIAIPVAPNETVELLKNEVDQVVTILIPPTSNFTSVAQFYDNFEEITDDKVVKIMKEMNLK
ncbi:MAG: phosphoribosyltransferase family protein [Nitrososphaeraceae archaeon]|jgi:putative phosphoribosyl transferase|nr:phosphoribosyltransferase family protein [Nitrososphaeraceae archaeon]MDW0135345.1 phosphoribosyltransferase family protein [Nitrososphaeraceae archaeon]